jgi:hypothetical protein
LNYEQIKEENSMRTSVKLGACLDKIPSQSVSNTVMHETLEKERVELPKIKATYKTNVEGLFDQKRDSFYLRGGTYHSHFNENSSHVD